MLPNSDNISMVQQCPKCHHIFGVQRVWDTKKFIPDKYFPSEPIPGDIHSIEGPVDIENAGKPHIPHIDMGDAACMIQGVRTGRFFVPAKRFLCRQCNLISFEENLISKRISSIGYMPEFDLLCPDCSSNDLVSYRDIDFEVGQA